MNKATAMLEQDKSFLKLRREGLVVGVELGDDGKAYAHTIGAVSGVETHGGFYKSTEEEQPTRSTKPTTRSTEENRCRRRREAADWATSR